MTDQKVKEIKEYDIYRDSLMRYLGEFRFAAIKF